MATTKKASSKKNAIDDNHIITMYMNSVLENNHRPKNVYLFCKENAIEESDFYSLGMIMYEMIMGGMEGATKANNEIVTVTRDSMI